MSLTARAQDALGLARDELRNQGAKRFEIFYARSQNLKIESKNQKIDTLSRSEDVGLSIRVLEDARVGFSFTTSLEGEAIRKAARTAFEVARVMPRDESLTLGHFSALEAASLLAMPLDREALAKSAEEKAKIAVELERLCRAADPRIVGVRAASFSESSYEVALLSHEDRAIGYESGRFSASLSCKAEEKGDAQMGWDFCVSPRFSELKIDTVARRGAERATRLLNAGKPKSMKTPAILENQVVANLVEFLSSSFSGEEIEKGKSTLRGKVGEKIFHSRVTIVDDGRLQDGYASRPFDAEGTLSQTTNLVKDGVFTSPLLDLTYARKLGLKSTGNSSRSVQAPPTISTTNLFLKPGTKSLPTLMTEMKNGIFITDLLGIHTANPVTGSFSVGASGILVENGQFTRPVKGFAVAGNIFDVFKNLTEIGSDLEFFGDTGAPSLLIPELAVSGE